MSHVYVLWFMPDLVCSTIGRDINPAITLDVWTIPGLNDTGIFNRVQVVDIPLCSSVGLEVPEDEVSRIGGGVIFDSYP